MYRSYIVAAAAAALLSASVPCHAGPCSAQIAQLERQILKAQATSPGGAGAPTAPQSVGAQLHHQPTPESVQSAERKANTAGEAALARARAADAADDASLCARALQEAKALYGLE